jgi:hypothetical protein
MDEETVLPSSRSGYYWVFGFRPLSSIPKNIKEHDISEAGFVAILR